MYLSGVFFYFEIVTEVEVWGEGVREGERGRGSRGGVPTLLWQHGYINLKTCFNKKLDIFKRRNNVSKTFNNLFNFCRDFYTFETVSTLKVVKSKYEF